VLYAFLGAMGVDVRGLFGPGLLEVIHEGWQLNRPWPRTPTSTIE
jgi:hypothetical protein